MEILKLRTGNMNAKLVKFCLSLLFTTCILTASAQTITDTEAVEYDPTGNRFLITNGNSILQQNSGSDELSFFGNGEAGFGMEVIGNTLFAITGGFSQSVKAYDLTTELELFSFSPPATEFLNGMASDPAGNRIWISDFSSGDILEMDVSNFAAPSSTTPIINVGCAPNGITYDEDNNRLVFTCWNGGDLKEVDLTDYSVSTLVNTGLSNIDGIDHDGQGNFYISSWNPTRITKYSSDFTVDEIITAPGISNPADISYAIEIDTLAIANSGNSTVTYIGFGSVGIDEINPVSDAKVYPNPISNVSVVEFELSTATSCQVNLYDQSGRLVYTLLNEDKIVGSQKILLAGLELSAGIYFCEIRTDNRSEILKLVSE